MPDLGYYTLPVIPSFRGIDAAINKQLGAKLDGRKIGEQYGNSVADGVRRSGVSNSLHSILNSGEFTSKAEKAGAVAGKLIGSTIGLGITGGIGVAAAGVTATVGILGTALAKGFQRLESIDSAKFKLQALGHSAAETQSIMDNALASVKGTAFGLEAAATAAASAVAAGIEPGEQLTKYLKEIGDAASIAGTSFEDMGSIFNKIQTSNKAYTDDLQQLSDRGIPIFQWLQREYGVTAEELTKMVQSGEVDAAHFQHAIETNIGGAAQKMGQSLEGSIQNAEAALSRFGAALLKPVFGNFAGGVGSITDALDRMTAWVDDHQAEVIGAFEAMGDGVITFSEVSVRSIGLFTEGLGQLVAPLGDTLGGLTQFNASVQRLLGRDDIADQLDKDAQGFFSMGEGLTAFGRSAKEVNFDGLRDKLHGWADAARGASDNTRGWWSQVGALNDKLAALPPRKDVAITVTAAVSEAQRTIDNFFNQNSNRQLPVALNPNIPGTAPGRNPLDVIAGRATGGPISGPGGPTSDIIPIWASNGEHMWTANEVNAVGGQSSMYRLRAAARAGLFKGFAEGGAIGNAGLNPGAAYLREEIMKIWPQITNIGGRRSEDGFGEHSSGNAMDVMIPNYNTPQGKAIGDAIAAFAVNNKDTLGLDGIIWRQTSYGYGSGDFSKGTPMSDRGSDTQNHMDHVHIMLGKGRGAGAAAVGLPKSSLKLPGDVSVGGNAGGLDFISTATGATSGGTPPTASYGGSGGGLGQFGELGNIASSFLKETFGLDGSFLPDISQLGVVQFGSNLLNAFKGPLQGLVDGKLGIQQPGWVPGMPVNGVAAPKLPWDQSTSLPPLPTDGTHPGTGAAPGPVTIDQSTTINSPTGDPNDIENRIRRANVNRPRIDSYAIPGF